MKFHNCKGSKPTICVDFKLVLSAIYILSTVFVKSYSAFASCSTGCSIVLCDVESCARPGTRAIALLLFCVSPLKLPVGQSQDIGDTLCGGDVEFEKQGMHLLTISDNCILI